MTSRPPIRSDGAIQLLGELQLVPGARLCVACAARHMRVEKWTVLKLIRETVLLGDVMCVQAPCSRRRRIETVATLRPLPFSRLDGQAPDEQHP